MTLNEFLLSRGIDDPEHYTNLSWNDVNSPENLNQIKKAKSLLLKHIKARTPIRILVDTDTDGYTSATMLYLSLEWMNHIGRGILVKYILHNTNKSHGLSKNDCDIDAQDNMLLIIPDAGTNDDDYIDALTRQGVDVLVLDHHPREHINKTLNAVLVNPQTSPQYTNKELCGAGVVYQFLRSVSKNKTEYKYDDLCALALIADVMDMRSYETKFLTTTGLSDIRNPFLQSLITYTEKKTNGNITIRNIQMYVVPLINAIIRMGSFEERDLLFKAFCTADKEMHSRVIFIAEDCKTRQNEIIDKWMSNLQFNTTDNLLVKHCELNDGILGVVAQKIYSLTGINTIVFGEEQQGHARGCSNFKSLCEASGFCEACHGHEGAFGIDIKEENIQKLIRYMNEHREKNSKKEYDILESKEFVFDSANLNPLCEFNSFFGTGISPLSVKFENNIFSYEDISIIGKNKDTLKIAYDDQVYVMVFFYNKNKSFCDQIKKIRKDKSDFTMSAICEVSRSEYFGKRSWSLIANEYEVKQL